MIAKYKTIDGFQCHATTKKNYSVEKAKKMLCLVPFPQMGDRAGKKML